MADNNKIKKIIENSFIAPDQKRELLQYIEQKGVDMKLFDKLNDYLVEATKNKRAIYHQKIKKLNSLQTELDDRVTSEKFEIEEKLEQELADLDPLDLETKRRIWREYYDTLDELGERYGKGLKDIISRILTPTS